VSQIVVEYLRERFDLIPQEPTPLESALWLVRFGYAASLTGAVRQLLEECAVARFGPGPTQAGDLAGPAHGLIVALEESPCPPLS
jgi:hypothetical protein